MFAHQVIEDMTKNQHIYDTGCLLQWCAAIKNSQHFYFGDCQEIAKFVGAESGRAILFQGDFGEEIFPPFKQCWFDFVSPPLRFRFSKLGFLVGDLRPKINEISFACFEASRKHGVWGPWPFVWFVNLETKLVTCESSGLYKDEDTIFDDKAQASDMAQEGLQPLGYANFALMMLNCKNIGTEKNYPPPALNKKRLKHHKQPLFTYHTLVLKPVGKKQESIPRHLWQNRIHLCRGHFKTYTADNPLFGRITGRFWWQPVVRGRNHDGVVMKDYRVDPPLD